MISVLRNGPKLVILESSSAESLNNILESKVGAIKTDFSTAFEMADQGSTIVFITDPGKKEIHLDDVKTTLFVPMSSDGFFSSIINLKATHYIEHSQIPPGLMVMRTVGNTDKVIQSVAKTYKGEVMPFTECLNKGASSQTIVSFTQKPVNRRLSLKEDIESKHILVDMEAHRLYRKMRNQVLRFFNEGFENENWYDVQIRIYDRYGKYETHLERLFLILNSLDIGMVLGESWGKDHPRFLMSVLVYQVRVVTLLEPNEIKRILIGLEYIDDGTRVIDLDLIYKGNKVDWPTVLEKKSRIKSRNALGKACRNKLLNELTSEDKSVLLSLEEEIKKSRS